MIVAVVLWWIVIAVRRVRDRPAGAVEPRRGGACCRPGCSSGSTSRCSSPPSATRASPTPSSSPPSARSSLVPLGALLFHEQPDRRALPWGWPVARRAGDGAVPRRQPGRGHAWRATSSSWSSSATWVGYLLTGRRARATVDVVDFMATMMPIGVLTAAPIALILAGDEIWPLTAQGVDRRRPARRAHRHDRPRPDRLRPARGRRRRRSASSRSPSRRSPSCWSFLLLGEAIRPPRSPAWSSSSSASSPSRSSASAAPTPRPLRVVADQHGELAGPVG